MKKWNARSVRSVLPQAVEHLQSWGYFQPEEYEQVLDIAQQVFGEAYEAVLEDLEELAFFVSDLQVATLIVAYALDKTRATSRTYNWLADLMIQYAETEKERALELPL